MSLVTESCIVAQCGFQGDATTLLKNMKGKIRIYEHQHQEQPSAPAIAAMLSTMLYYRWFYNYDHVSNFSFRRFFPYYVYNLVAGLDDEGKGAVFSYDPVGSYDRDEMKCAGSAASLIQPFLDNQIGRQHIQVRTTYSIDIGKIKTETTWFQMPTIPWTGTKLSKGYFLINHNFKKGMHLGTDPRFSSASLQNELF